MAEKGKIEVKEDKVTLDSVKKQLDDACAKIRRHSENWVRHMNVHHEEGNGTVDGFTNLRTMLASVAIMLCLSFGYVFAAEEILVRWDAPEGTDAVVEINADERDDSADVGEIIMTTSGTMKIDVGGTTAATFSSSGVAGAVAATTISASGKIAANADVTIGTTLGLTKTTIAATEAFILTNLSAYVSLTTTGAVTSSATTAIADGSAANNYLVIENAGAADVILKDGANTKLGGDMTLTGGANDTIVLIWNGADWLSLGQTDN